MQRDYGVVKGEHIWGILSHSFANSPGEEWQFIEEGRSVKIAPGSDIHVFERTKVLHIHAKKDLELIGPINYRGMKSGSLEDGHKEAKESSRKIWTGWMCVFLTIAIIGLLLPPVGRMMIFLMLFIGMPMIFIAIKKEPLRSSNDHQVAMPLKKNQDDGGSSDVTYPLLMAHDGKIDVSAADSGGGDSGDGGGDGGDGGGDGGGGGGD